MNRNWRRSTYLSFRRPARRPPPCANVASGRNGKYGLAEQESINPDAIRYANRLSDHLLCLADTSTAWARTMCFGCRAGTGRKSEQFALIPAAL